MVPEVAQSLPSRSADGRTYTFTIRPASASPPVERHGHRPHVKDTIWGARLEPRTRTRTGRAADIVVRTPTWPAGRAHQGVIAHGGSRTVRLTAPAPDLLARPPTPSARSPSGTPVDPNGYARSPSAGPYHVASYTPRASVIRDPSYRGTRPHRLARIEVAVASRGGAPSPRWSPAPPTTPWTADRRCRTRGDFAGRRGYLVDPESALDFIALDGRRICSPGARMRRAVRPPRSTAPASPAPAAPQALPEPPRRRRCLPPGYRVSRRPHLYGPATRSGEGRERLRAWPQGRERRV